MTLGDQTTYAERLFRTDTNYTTITNTSDATKKYINEGVREFCKVVNGIPKEEYITIAPRFDSRTNWAIRLTITGGANALAATDIAVTSTNRSNTTGTQIATDLQATIRTAGVGDETVTFSTTTWKFTIDSISGTDVTVEAPSRIDYVDATDLYFGKTGNSSAQTWVSEIGVDSTVEADLPTGFYDITQAEWDRDKLYAAPWEVFLSPQYSGTPRWYGVKNKKIRIRPYPVSQKLFHIYYRGEETDLAVDGTADGTDCPLPAETHMAPVHYAVSKLLEEGHEFDKADRHLQRFYTMARNYQIREDNQAPTMFPGAVYSQPPRVNVS